MFQILGIRIYIFPVIIILATYICIWIFVHSTKYDHFYYIWIKKSAAYVMTGAIVCGKLLYAATRILEGNYGILNVLNGFIFYGGFLGVILGLYIFSRKENIRFSDITDVYASFFPLGQAIGRIGCYFNGCCYGKEYTGFGAVNYVVDGIETTVFPTWFVESMFCILLFLCFFRISKRMYSGMYFAYYMMSYGIFRFIIENYRGDMIRGVWYGISTSQYISIMVVIGGVWYAFYSVRLKRKNLMIIGRDRIG